jgi:hypothetical protein
MTRKHADKQIFYVCLVISIVLFVGGFFCPPIGQIDGSVLTAGGILLGFATIAIAGQNLANGKDVTIKNGDIEISVDEERDKQ